MQNKKQIKFCQPRGLYPALLTPFNHAGKVNGKELKKLVKWLVDQGVDGVFPLGSCGEAIHLTFEERVLAVELVLQAVDGRVPVIPGASDSCARNVIRFAKKLKELGCAGAVICPPYYLPVSEESIIAHYEKILTQVPDLPIILYNAPAFSAPLTYNVVEKIAQYPNVVSIKDSSGNMVDFVNFLNIANKSEQMGVMAGREEMLLATLIMGGSGTLSTSVGIVPEIMIAIDQAWQTGAYEKAQALQFSIVELASRMNKLPFPVGYKKALDIRGFNMGEPIRPLSVQEKEDTVSIENELSNLLDNLLAGKVKIDL